MERKLENLFRLMPQVCIAECNLMDEKYFILDAREEGICSRQCIKRVGSGKGREGREGRKFSFGEKPVRLKGRKVEEAEETNKERKETGGGREEEGGELGGTGHTWLQMRPQMLRVITDDGKQFVKRAITVPIHNTEEYR